MTVRPRRPDDLVPLVAALRQTHERDGYPVRWREAGAGPARWWVPGGGPSLLLVAPA